MSDLASITLSKFGSSDPKGLIVRDIADWDVKPGGGSTVNFKDGRPPLEVTETVTAIQDKINALWDESNLIAAAYLQITDGVAAPGTASGMARIYVDTADGDLKVIFGDAVIKTLATDT